MAPRAPRPGSTPSSNGLAARKRAKRLGYKVTIGDESWTLHTADIGPGDDFLVRKQTGIPLSTFLSDSGFDSIAVIIWTARRKAGEKRLTLQRVMDEMPSLEELEEMAENDEFILEQLENVEDDVIDADSEEVPALPDPLPSGATEAK